MSKLKTLLIPLLLLVLAFTIRFAFISKGPYHSDTLYFAEQSQKSFETKEFHFLHSHGFPLTAVLGTVFYALLTVFNITDSVFAVNLFSVVTSSLAVLALYCLARELMDRTGALLSTLLLCFSPIFLLNSVYGNSHTIVLLFILSGLYYLTRYHKANKRWNLYSAALLFGLAGASRIQDLAVVSVPIILSFFSPPFPEANNYSIKGKTRAFIQALLITMGIITLFYLPVMLGGHPALKSENKFTWFVNYNIFNNISGSLLDYRYILSYFEINFSKAGLLYILLGFLVALKINRPLFNFLTLWFAFPYLAYGQLNISTDRFFIVCLPPACLVIGHVWVFLIQKKKWIKAAFLCGIACILFYMLAYCRPILAYRHNHARLPEFARWVGSKTEENAYIIFADGGQFISVFAKRNVLSRPLGYRFTKKQLLDFKHSLDIRLGQNIPVYITSAALFSYNVDKQFSDFIESNYTMTELGEHIYEDWHAGAVFLDLYNIKLYKIQEK